MSEVISKRLHVSGLTPQISTVDLTSRFSSFGTVKAVDGLGKLDALGQPRPYAYVTVETTKSQLAKCMNLLSGSTWKGARLRIGEAKADFRERIKRENEAANDSETRPSKRRRLARGVQGVHAADMSLPASTSLRPGWKITPLGRLVRPMRMRPLRPLPETTSIDLKRTASSKRRKVKHGTCVRARRRKIDPEEWGSTYLSGVMLESGSGIILPDKSSKKESQNSSATDKQHPEEVVHHFSHASPSLSPSSPLDPVGIDIGAVADEFYNIEHDPEARMDLGEEKFRSLAILESLFGPGRATDKPNGQSEEDWGSSESLSEFDVDIDQAEGTVMTSEISIEDDDIEYVPRASLAQSTSKAEESGKTDFASEDCSHPQTQEEAATEVAQPEMQRSVQTTKLKEMFAPRPEDAGFSILDNLDLELDEELTPISAQPPPVPQLSSSAPQKTPIDLPSSAIHQSTDTFDPNYPFFFPHSLLPNSSLKLRPGDPRDVFSQKIDFFRTESDEEIRARWESRKVELTRDWKRRHREAVKSARRRGGIQD